MKNADMPVMPIATDTESVQGAYLVGLTKREYFAGLAMQGIVSNPTTEATMNNIGEAAVNMADALLAALEEK